MWTVRTRIFPLYKFLCGHLTLRLQAADGKICVFFLLVVTDQGTQRVKEYPCTFVFCYNYYMFYFLFLCMEYSSRSNVTCYARDGRTMFEVDNTHALNYVNFMLLSQYILLLHKFFSFVLFFSWFSYVVRSKYQVYKCSQIFMLTVCRIEFSKNRQLLVHRIFFFSISKTNVNNLLLAVVVRPMLDTYLGRQF